MDCKDKNDYTYYKDLIVQQKTIIKCLLGCHKLVKYMNNSNNKQCTNELCKRDYSGEIYWICQKKDCEQQSNVCNGCIMNEQFIDYKNNIGDKRILETTSDLIDLEPNRKKRKLNRPKIKRSFTPQMKKKRKELFRHLQQNRFEYTYTI